MVRIYEDISTPEEQYRWYWAINGVHPGRTMHLQSRAATLEAADLRKNWEKWLAWSKLVELP
jgi:hypothetical protein